MPRRSHKDKVYRAEFKVSAVKASPQGEESYRYLLKDLEFLKMTYSENGFYSIMVIESLTSAIKRE